jgi:hypothetical protein
MVMQNKKIKLEMLNLKLFETNNIVCNRLWEELKCKPHLF